VEKKSLESPVKQQPDYPIGDRDLYESKDGIYEVINNDLESFEVLNVLNNEKKIISNAEFKSEFKLVSPSYKQTESWFVTSELNTFWNKLSNELRKAFLIGCDIDDKYAAYSIDELGVKDAEIVDTLYNKYHSCKEKLDFNKEASTIAFLKQSASDNVVARFKVEEGFGFEIGNTVACYKDDTFVVGPIVETHYDEITGTNIYTISNYDQELVLVTESELRKTADFQEYDWDPGSYWEVVKADGHIRLRRKQED